jgi:hypothetical protein
MRDRFDDISRILASDLPRRDAVKLAVGVLFGGTAILALPETALAVAPLCNAASCAGSPAFACTRNGAVIPGCCCPQATPRCCDTGTAVECCTNAGDCKACLGGTNHKCCTAPTPDCCDTGTGVVCCAAGDCHVCRGGIFPVYNCCPPATPECCNTDGGTTLQCCATGGCKQCSGTGVRNFMCCPPATPDCCSAHGPGGAISTTCCRAGGCAVCRNTTAPVVGDNFKCCPAATPDCCDNGGGVQQCCVAGGCSPCSNGTTRCCPPPATLCCAGEGPYAGAGSCCNPTTSPPQTCCTDTTKPGNPKTGKCCTPPGLEITALLAGPPVQVQMHVESYTGIPLTSITVLQAVNATVDIPPLTGQTAVTVTATKVDQSKSSVVALRNCTGCTDCGCDGVPGSCCRNDDPVYATVLRHTGAPLDEVYQGLPASESRITVQNGTPGLKNLRVTVNGKRFELAGIKDGESVKLDVASAMVPGSGNVIALTPLGKPGGSAAIIISG